MIASSSCCLNLSLHPTPSSLPINKSNIADWQMKKERSWRKPQILGVACVIIVLQTEYIDLDSIVLADELQTYVVSTNEKPEVMRWSEKRRCKPWRLNSLETIVPENLPRPTTRRRWEAVGFVGATAPPVKGVMIRNSSNSGCFSM